MLKTFSLKVHVALKWCMIQNHSLLKLRFGGIHLFHVNPEWKPISVSQPNHEPPTQQPAMKRIRGLAFSLKSLVHVLLKHDYVRKRISFSTENLQHTPLRPKKLTVAGGKWLALLKWNSKAWNQNTQTQKKKQCQIIDLYWFLYGKKGGKRHTRHWWLGKKWTTEVPSKSWWSKWVWILWLWLCVGSRPVGWVRGIRSEKTRKCCCGDLLLFFLRINNVDLVN